MTLSLQNSGKYLSRTWHRNRGRALVDRTRFDDDELAYLEIGESEGRGVWNDDTYMVETAPAEPSTPKEKIDVRKRPECGG